MVGVAIDAGVGEARWRTSPLPICWSGCSFGYWFENIEFILSAALVALLGSLGVGEAAARAALSRLARRGSLEGTSSAATPPTASRPAPSRPPERTAAACPALRQRPLDLGPAVDLCGVLHPRVRSPASPGAAPAAARASARPAVRRLLDHAPSATRRHRPVADRARGVRRRGVPGQRSAPPGGGRPAQRLGPAGAPGRLRGAHRLAGAGGRPGAAGHHARRRRPGGPSGGLRPLAVARAADPGLPEELLPPDWPQRRARQLFVEAYDSLGPAAERRVRELVATVRGVSSPSPRHRRVEDCLGAARAC